MAEPLVSVVIVHWNERDLLRNCLSSLEQVNYPNREIIVVDNASTDGAPEMVRTEFPSVKLIVNTENTGFARGNNIGIRQAGGRYIVALNADTTVEPNWIRAQVGVMEADPRIGLCQGKMMLLREPGKINSVGMVLTRNGLVKHVGDGEVDIGQYSRPRPIFGVSGACAFCRRETLDQIGLFDEDFFAYYEDLDLSWRARVRGWDCVFVPTAVVHHFRNATSARNDSLYWHLRYLNQRNRIWALLKNLSWGSLLCRAPWLLSFDVVMTAKGLKAWITRSRRPVELQARWDALRGLGKTLRKRRELQRARVAREADVLRLAFAAAVHS